MRIAVYGTGGVGGYFGGKLAQAGTDVHFIARGAHLKALREGGLRVRSVRGDFTVPVQATDDPGDVGPVDYVLFCVKSFDTEESARRLDPLLETETAVVSLQNGVDNEEKIAREVGWDHIMGGAAYIFSTIAEAGVIEHTAGPGRVVFGEWDGSRSKRAETLLAAFHGAEVDAELSENIQAVLWSKFAFICAQAGMTASVRLPVGEIRPVPEARQMFRRIVEEAIRVAEACGVTLPPETVDRHMTFADGLEPGGFSSLHHDLTHGRRMELETLHGTLVRLAREKGIAVPMSEAVYAILKPWAVRNEATAK